MGDGGLVSGGVLNRLNAAVTSGSETNFGKGRFKLIQLRLAVLQKNMEAVDGTHTIVPDQNRCCSIFF